MTQFPFRSIEIRLLIHSTEDEEKIICKLSKISKISKEEFERTNMIGHFGNPIILVRAHCVGIQAELSIKEIFSRIKKSEKKYLSSHIPDHLDEHGKLFIRINKQSLFSTKLSLYDQDSIRIKIKPKVRDANMLIQIYKDLVA